MSSATTLPAPLNLPWWPVKPKHFSAVTSAISLTTLQPLLDLINSLAKDLREIISKKLEEMDSFHVAWLELMSEIQVQTFERIKSTKSDIKSCRPQQHPGQDFWRNWLLTFVLEPWNSKAPDSASTTWLSQC